MITESNKAVFSRRREIEKRNELKVALNLTEDVFDKIFSLTATVKRGECKKEAGEIVYGGTVTFNAVFSAEETDRVEVGAKFTFKTADDGEGDRCSITYKTENVEVRSEGGMLYATCDLIAEITLFYEEEKEYLSFTDVLFKSGTITVNHGVPFEKEFSVEDEFTAKRIKRALLSDSEAIVTAVSCGDDFVTVDGEVVLNVCLLPFSENSDILKETRIIPFRFEIEADGVPRDGVSFARAAAEKTELKIFVDENAGKTTVSSEVYVRIEGEAYYQTLQNCVADAYSPDQKIDLRFEEITDRAAVSFESGSERVNKKAVCEVPEYSRLVRIIGERTDDLTFRKEEDDLVIEGVIGGTAIFSDSDNALVSSALKMPFSFTTRCETDAEMVSVVIENFAAKIRSGAIECDATLRYSYFKTASAEEKIVVSAVSGG